MAMGRIEKICSIMIMLGAERVEIIKNDEKSDKQIISFSSKGWKENGLSEEFNLVLPLGSKGNLTDKSVNAQIYLFALNFRAKTIYEKKTVEAMKNYVKKGKIGKLELDKVYNALSAAQSEFATKQELDRQEAVGRNVYEFLPKRDAKKNVKTDSLATFVCQIVKLRNNKNVNN